MRRQWRARHRRTSNFVVTRSARGRPERRVDIGHRPGCDDPGHQATDARRRVLPSMGTVSCIGAARSRNGAANQDIARGTQAFVKRQVNVDELQACPSFSTRRTGSRMLILE
jgi:hypothetical protein